MSATITTTTKEGVPTGAITVETLSDGAIGLGFVRTGMQARSIRLGRALAERLCEALTNELATPPETEIEARARVARGVADLLDPATVAEQLGGGNG